jgi:hypothetical protein
MKKFDLWFPKPMRTPDDMEAETGLIVGKPAYICLANPFDDGSGQHNLLRSEGHILILYEATTEKECCEQIDSLISDLHSLKAKVRQRFAE